MDAERNSNDKDIDLQIAEFWENFRLFPSRIEETVFQNVWIFSAIVLLPFILRLLISVLIDFRDVPHLIFYTKGGINLDYSAWAWTIDSFDQWILFLVTLCLLPAGWFFNRFLSEISEFFQWLPKSNHITTRDGNMKESYLRYLQSYQAALVSRKGQLATMVVFIVSLLGWLPLDLQWYERRLQRIAAYCSFEWVDEHVCSYMQEASQLEIVRDLIPYGFGYLLWVIFIALGVWFLFATGRQLRRLTDDFELIIKPGHHDRCGGLSPIGRFCFDMALPLAIGFVMIILVGVIALFLRPGEGFWPFPITAEWDSVSFIIVFGMLVLTPLTIFTFFAPLLGIHQAMVKEKRIAEDAYAEKLAELENDIWFVVENKMEPAKAKDARERLKTFQVLDPYMSEYPEWPFRRETVVRLFSPQIVAFVLGLIIDLRELISR